jgi:hypothetical protein
VKFHQPGTSSLFTLDLNANVNNGRRLHQRTGMITNTDLLPQRYHFLLSMVKDLNVFPFDNDMKKAHFGTKLCIYHEKTTLFYDQNYVNLSNLKFHPLCHSLHFFENRPYGKMFHILESYIIDLYL